MSYSALAANGPLPWFDSWGEGPFTLDEVQRYVKTAPSQASAYHTLNGLRFSDFLRLSGQGPESADRPTAVRVG